MKCQVLNEILKAVKRSARTKLNLLHTEEDYTRSEIKVTFKCQLCNQEFEAEGNLKNHQKSCLGEAPQDPKRQRCGNCRKEITTSNFARHRRTCGGQNPPPLRPRPPSRRSQCDICGILITVANLARHKTLKHEQ